VASLLQWQQHMLQTLPFFSSDLIKPPKQKILIEAALHSDRFIRFSLLEGMRHCMLPCATLA
jgi:hypothetical protein